MITLKDAIRIQNSLESGLHQFTVVPNAQVTIVHFIEKDCDATIEFLLEPLSILHYHPIIIGGLNNKITLSIQLQKSAEAIINGAYVLNNKQQSVLITHQNHKEPEAKSSLIINGIAADEALITYNGSISIQKNAAQSNALQENKTVLLGSRAKAISVPSLEVQTNDVQCAHGSAVGPLQEDQLLYAQSRGLSLQNARRLLITSFFAQTLEGMLDEKLRDEIIERLVSKALQEKE